LWRRRKEQKASEWVRASVEGYAIMPERWATRGQKRAAAVEQGAKAGCNGKAGCGKWATKRAKQQQQQEYNWARGPQEKKEEGRAKKRVQLRGMRRE